MLNLVENILFGIEIILHRAKVFSCDYLVDRHQRRPNKSSMTGTEKEHHHLARYAYTIIYFHWEK